MEHLIQEIARYLIILLILIDTYYSFAYYKKRNVAVLNFCLFAVHFLGFLVLFLSTGNENLILLYGAELVYLILVQTFFFMAYPDASRIFTSLVCMLMVIGFVMLARLSFGKANRQFLILAVGTVFIPLIPYMMKKWKALRKFAWLYGIAGALVLLVVLILAETSYGAKLSLTLLGISFQPSEFVKISYVFFIAAMFEVRTDWKQVVKTGILAAVHILILVASTDLGGALIFSLVFVFMVYAATKKPIYLFGGLAAGAGASYIAYRAFSHVQIRVTAWIDPWSVIESKGYQIAQSLFAIGTGGWLGVGINQGSPSQIPVVEEDFIFSAIAEEMGGLVAICLIFICLGCLLLMFNIALKVQSNFYRYMALGLACEYGIQVFLTIGGAIKLIPSTGVTIPFVSCGGSSMLSSLVMYAIIQGLYILEADRQSLQELCVEAGRAEKNNRTIRAEVGRAEENDRKISAEAGRAEENDRKISAEAGRAEENDRKISAEAKRTEENNRKISVRKKEDNKKERRQVRSENIKNKKTIGNRELYLVMYLFTGLFLLMPCYLGHFFLTDRKEIINNPYNLRQENFEKKVVRGSILTSDGEVIARTETDSDGMESRVYPYDNLFSHVVGYAQSGKDGLEKIYNFQLLTSDIPVYEKIANGLRNEKDNGNQLLTTLHYSLQKTAFDALDGEQGAVVVMEPSTGKILAMVSKPDYNPNQIEEIWESLSESEDNEQSFLLNRATQGRYPPGSTFKILTALEYLREYPEEIADFSYTCNGSYQYEGAVIHCYHKTVHGTLSFEMAFAKSCNGAFASIGPKLSAERFTSLCESFLLNQDLPLALSYVSSQFHMTESSPIWEVLQTVIGQGAVEMTPLHQAMVAAAIANGGVMMKPYLVDAITDAHGNLVKRYQPQSCAVPMQKEEAEWLTKWMTACVTDGTGTKAASERYQVAGKTGTAEWDAQKEAHSWFVGFAPAQAPEIVVSVIVEEGGAGSTKAALIAGKIFEVWYDLKE